MISVKPIQLLGLVKLQSLFVAGITVDLYVVKHSIVTIVIKCVQNRVV